MISDESTVSEMPIKPGLEGDLLMELIPLDGSDPEDVKVVLNPTEKLKNGMVVRVKETEEEEKQ